MTNSDNTEQAARAGDALPVPALPLRDERGRWRPGTGGGGGRSRPGSRRPRITDIARELAAEHGIDVRDMLRQVLASTLAQAASGDVQAQRLVLPLLSRSDPEADLEDARLAVLGAGPWAGPQPPAGYAFADWVRSCASFGADLDSSLPGADLMREAAAGRSDWLAAADAIEQRLDAGDDDGAYGLAARLIGAPIVPWDHDELDRQREARAAAHDPGQPAR